PILEAALRNVGAFGTETSSNPDILGDRFGSRLFHDITNAASNAGIVLPWATTDDNGTPERFPMNDLSTRISNLVAPHLSGKLPGTQEVLPRNPDSGPATNFNAYLLGIVRRDNPGLGDEQIADLATDAMADPSSDAYQQALDAYSSGPGIQVLQGHNLPDWLQRGVDTVANAVVSKVVPLNPVVTPATRNELTAIPSEERTPGQQAMNDAMYSTPDAAAYDELIEGYKTAGSGQGRLTADSYYAIRGGDDGLQSFRLGDQVISPAMLDAMSEEERKQVADDWLQWVGGEDLLAQHFATRDAYIAEHPEIAPAVEFQKRAGEYAGGKDAFIRETAAINAPYRQYLTNLATSPEFAPGTDGFRNQATSYGAYRPSSVNPAAPSASTPIRAAPARSPASTACPWNRPSPPARKPRPPSKQPTRRTTSSSPASKTTSPPSPKFKPSSTPGIPAAACGAPTWPGPPATSRSASTKPPTTPWKASSGWSSPAAAPPTT
ncbi:MAG: hypothetical protein M3509_07890, partial [Chloroflexota bacterium]|nr:hypothetical protein [Chloroflexota bacterium]